MRRPRTQVLAVLGLLVSTFACAGVMSHPPMSRADVGTTDPGYSHPVPTRVRSPTSAAVTVTRSAVDATGSAAGSTKVGRATCHNVLGAVAWGDATVEAAARSAGITTIHHVDAESLRIFYFYSQYTTVVYGE